MKHARLLAGIRMRVNHDKIAEIEVIFETTGYWGFNVDNYLKYAALEDWSPIEPLKRHSRGTLVQAANDPGFGATGARLSDAVESLIGPELVGPELVLLL